MAVNVEMFKDKERRRWPLVLLLLVLFGVGCPALLITTPWQRTQAQARFVPKSLHSLQSADYNQDPDPPLFAAVRMDLIWDAILDRDPTAIIDVRRNQLLASLGETIPTSSSVCEGQHVIPITRDTWIDSENPTMTTGDDTILQLSRSGDEVKRVLLYFPVDDYLQRGTYIHRARLELHLTDPASPKPRAVHFFNLKQPFDETTTNWLNQPDAYIDVLPPTVMGRDIHTWDITDIVRSWLLGHYANNGLMLELPPEAIMALRYYSREADTRLNFAVGDTPFSPQLVIDCQPEQAITELPPDPAPGPPADPNNNIPAAEVPTPAATPIATRTPLPTLTPTPGGIIPLPTLIPTFTPIPPPTEIPTPSVTPTPNPTATPIPPTSRPPTSTPVPPQKRADVAITKSDSPDPVTSGGVLTYNLNVTNNGPDQATSVSVTDSLPAGVTLLTTTSSQGTCTGTTCNLGTLANGGSVFVSIDVRVDAASGTLNNTASVSANETDPNTGNNSATIDTTIALPTDADLDITKSDSSDPVLSGDNLTYTLNVTNNGPANATGVSVVDTLPTGVTLVSINASQGSGCTGTNCDLGTLDSGNSATITIVVTVNATSGTLSNTGTVSGNEPDPNAANNSATKATTITPSADLSISKTRTPPTVLPGGNVTYSIFVTNNGPSVATNVVVTDTLPSGVTPAGLPPGCSGATTITCNRGSINSGITDSFVIVVTVDAGTSPGTLVNTATVGGNEFDPNTGNNTATASVDVVLPSITIGDVSLLEGNSGTTDFDFTLSLSSSTAQVVTVTFTTADDTATLADSDYVFNTGTVVFPAGTTVQTVTVQVNGDTTIEPDETFFVNLSSPINATISDGQGEGTILNDDGSCTPTDVFTAVADSYIGSGQPGDNHGAEPVLSTKPNGNIQRALIQFDLSTIPTTATVACAELQIYQQGDPEVALTADVHGVTASWVETQVTWNDRDSSIPLTWTSVGGDYGGSVTSFSLGITGTRTIDIASLAQNWVTTPGANYGLIILTSPGGATVSFDSREAANPPRLVIQY